MGLLGKLLQAFFAINRRACLRIERYLPQAREDIFEVYVKRVAHHVNSLPSPIVVDVGGGKSCPFARYIGCAARATIIAVDVSREELAGNHTVQARLVSDVAKALPFRPQVVDVITSRSFLEHVRDVRGCVKNAAEVLRTRGYLIHLFPSRNAVFALMNRAVPNALARRLLDIFAPPECGGAVGFPAFYNGCDYSAMSALLREQQFVIVEVKLSYYQSRYYDFFLPFFLVSAFYEIAIQLLGLKGLAAYILIVARKR
jgi:2-polyprenyl-6-hydroxyphenyl methylase/3-demethylubiquinone-9 3-methyltransferase